jgi:hypothetical protein
MADDAIASGAVFSDIDGDRLIPELKMVMSLLAMILTKETIAVLSRSRMIKERPRFLSSCGILMAVVPP